VYPLDRADRLLVDVDHGKRSAGDGLDGGEKKHDDCVEGGEHEGVCIEA
jgi:hypothetical protein